MDVGIIGAGNIGSALAHQFARAGHRVLIANSRGPETLTELVESIPGDVRATDAAGAARFGDLVVESVPLKSVVDLPAGKLAGKVVIDTANYYPGRDGEIDFGGRSTSEWVAEQLGGLTLVKAFNTIYARVLASDDRADLPPDDRIVIPIAGDDEQAKATVANLIDEIGFGPLDTGSLSNSTNQEPGTPIYGNMITLREARDLLRPEP
jgi:8-hydroxy-5-deazaflavin:NADPH oxidoreductase